jgi:hypothetical protein
MSDTFFLMFWTMALRDKGMTLEELQEDMKSWAKLIGVPITDFTEERPHLNALVLQLMGYR